MPNKSSADRCWAMIVSPKLNGLHGIIDEDTFPLDYVITYH